MTTSTDVPVQDRLDLLSNQLTDISETLHAERAERERLRDLVHELTPVLQGAMTLASDELDDLSRDVTIDDAVRLARTAARAMPALESLLAQLVSLGDLTHEVTSLAGPGVDSLSTALAAAESRGYFTAARYGAGAVDRFVVTLNDTRHDPTPSTLALLRRLRDPQVRRGLARALDLLGALGSVPPPAVRPTGPTGDRPTGTPHPEKD